MNRWWLLLIPILMSLSLFFHVPDRIEPTLSFALSDKILFQRPSPFAPLSSDEENTPLGRELIIAAGFSSQLDLYQAVTTYKRAAILASKINSSRLNEINYHIFFCYYLAGKYQEAIATFENTSLRQVEPSFKPYSDLLILLYECYIQNEEDKKAERSLQVLSQVNPTLANKLLLWSSFFKADFASLESMENRYPFIKPFLQMYQNHKKNPLTAELLNTFLPGSGYLYLEQYQSAITAFLLNGLFIGSSSAFFIKGYKLAGILFASFEMGWYYGGVLGVGGETNTYNQIIYENLSKNLLYQNGLFPALLLQYGF